MTGRRIAWVVVVLVAALLLYAWIDGGEEPVRPIAERIDLPETAE